MSFLARDLGNHLPCACAARCTDVPPTTWTGPSGARSPATSFIEQPTTAELVVNLKTDQAFE
jgi:hypothetical protein